VRAVCALFATALLWPSVAAARVEAGPGLSFVWPADGVITSPFGLRPGEFHPGVDIGILRSLAVRSASAGRVVAAGDLTGYEGYGNVVVVSLRGGLTLVYAHLAAPLVRAGEFVLPGATLGIAGCTGWCTGTHLHFELRDHGRPIDPLSFLPLGYTGSSRQGG
jgi:murein DD-endopeptidase MepM/ murein hydrolase activator NlpD